MASPYPVLILTSHARTPPLQPPPDLRYDLRNIPNPPRDLRAVSDGRSKRIREHLLHEPKFVQRLEAIEADIRAAMERKLQDTRTDPRGPPEQPQELLMEYRSSEKSQTANVSVASTGNLNEHTQDSVEEQPEEQDVVVLRVGCNCALGHHRSVAFVEELARREWPKEWRVDVVHRDVDRKRAAGKREAQRREFGKKRRVGLGVSQQSSP